MNIFLILESIFFTFLITSYGQTNEWNTEDLKNYSIDCPADWEFNESGQLGSVFILLSPLDSPQDQFRENVNFIVQDLKGYNLDLDGYVELSEQQIETLITDGNLIESTRMTNQDQEYQKTIYTGKQGIYNLKVEQYYWVIDDKAFILTLTCEASQFDHYKLTGEKILNSFKFK